MGDLGGRLVFGEGIGVVESVVLSFDTVSSIKLRL